MKPTNNYGLSDSLIDTVRKSVEEAKLHPNQQKLDVHEPEKDELTSQDFKKLRSGKKVKDGIDTHPKLKEEEYEQMDEISSELAGRASNARIDRNMSGGTSHTDIRKLKKGITPLDQQTKTIAGYTKTLDRKNEEEEQMDEVKLADLPRRMVKGTSYGANYVDPEGADETAADMKKPEPKRKSGPQGTMKRRFNTKSYTKLRSQYK